MEKEKKEIKKAWYKNKWGIILAIILFPITLLLLPWILIIWGTKKWWERSRLDVAKKRKILYIAGSVVALFFVLAIIAGVAAQDMPILNNIKSPTGNPQIVVSGYDVSPNTKVSLSLNGGASVDVNSDESGKFSFPEITLNEGKNTIKIETITAKGKALTLTRSVVYKKPKPKEDPKQEVKEEPKQEEVKEELKEETKEEPQPVVEQPKQEEQKPVVEEKPKEKTVMDRLWEALDESIKTREGIDIQYFGKYFENSTELRRNNNLVRVTFEPKSYWDETDQVRTAYNQFVKYSSKAFEIGEVDEVEFFYWNTFTDQYGKSDKEKAVNISMTKDEFKKYNWSGLVGRSIYNQMIDSCSTHWIHLAIMKNLKTDKLILSSY